jgi:hypothetical protein
MFYMHLSQLVIIGRIHTDKSTICNMLQNHFHISQPACLFAIIRNITFNWITTTHKDNAYVFNIIDSPDWYNCMRNESNHLTNETTLKNHLNQCIIKDVLDPHIHAFDFICSSSTSINIEDIINQWYLFKNIV